MLKFVLIAVGGWFFITVLLHLLQTRLIFFPTRAYDATPADVGLAFEEVMLPAANGERVAAWFVKTEDARGAVLFCHGNAGNISHRIDTIRILAGLGLDVLIFDYEGYGKSTGSPSEAAMYRDVLAAYDFLVTEKQVAPRRIIAFGRSLGAGAATWIAAEREVAGLVIESTFTSLPDLGRELYPFFVIRPFVRHRLDNAERIARVHSPILVAHSRTDEIVPYSHGRRLFELANEPKTFVELIGDHNGGYQRTGRDYSDALDRFLRATLSNGAASPTIEPR